MIALSSSRTVTNDLPLYLVCAVQMLLQLDVSIVNVALASMDRELGFSGGLQWVAGGYALAYGSLLLLGGRLADRFGRKPILLAGLVAFALASLVGGLAGDPVVLVGARVAQGIAAAAVAPAALALLTTLFETPAERARALGFSQAAMAGGATIAVVVGGALVELFGWRAVMLVNLPLIAVLLPLLIWRVPDRAADTSAGAGWLPPALVSLALCGVVSGLGLAETEGFGSPMVIGLMAAGLATGAVWLLLERSSATPMLPAGFLASRQRAAALFSIFGLGGVMAGYVFFVTLYLQRAVGLSPLMTGLALVPSTVMVMGMSLFVGRTLITRWGLRRVLLVGVGAVMLGQGLLAFATTDYWLTVFPGLVITAGGMGLALPAGSVAFMAGVADGVRGTASGLIVTGQQTGVAAALAVLTTAAAGASGADYAFATAFMGTASLSALVLVVLLVGLRARQA